MDGRAQLKTFFLTGEKPTQGQFADLIDSCFNLTDDTIPISMVVGLAAILGSKLSTSSLIPSLRTIIPDADSRLSNASGIWTLTWDNTLSSKFGTDEATIKVLFDNGSGTFKEQKGIQPIYNYTGSAVSSITLEIMIEITFKIIITV